MGEFVQTVHVCYFFCCHKFAKLPRWFTWVVVFYVANIIGDVAAFPLCHTFWNLVGFEGWFHKEEG